MEYQATDSIGQGGHRVRRLPNTTSEVVGSIPRGSKIRLTQISENGWGKLDISVETLLKGAPNYKSVDLSTEGWTMVSGNGQTFFELVPTNTTDGSSEVIASPSTYTVYKTTSIVKKLGLKVRRHATIDSDQVGSVAQGGTVHISRVQDGWGKVHPSMASALRASLKYQPHDLATEGWMRMGGDDGAYLEPVVSASPASTTAVVAPTSDASGKNETQEYTLYRTTSAVPDGGMIVRRVPTITSEQVGSVRKDEIIRVTEVFDCSNHLWGKLHPSMSLVGTLNYCAHDITTEGWTRLNGDADMNDQREVFFEIVPGTTMSPGVTTSLSRDYVEFELTPRCFLNTVVFRTELVRVSDICGTLVRGTKIRISKIHGDMGKLHPSMAHQLSKSEKYQPFDIESEGWTSMANMMLASSTSAPVEEEPVRVPNSTILEYQATDSIGQGGHRVRRQSNTTSEVVGHIPRGSTIRLTEVVNGWGKLDVSMDTMLKGSSTYKPHDLNTEGWTMVSANGQTFFEPVETPNRSSQAFTPLDSSASAYTVYKTTSIVKKLGLKVRRHATIDSDQVGSVAQGGTVHISRVQDGWGKVHPSMASALSASLKYQPHDLATEGWMRMGGDDGAYLEPIVSASPTTPGASTTIANGTNASNTATNVTKANETLEYTLYRTTDDVLIAGMMVRRIPNITSDQIGSIRQNEVIRVTEVFNCSNHLWGKLHPSMSFVGTNGYREHDLRNEGWTRISGFNTNLGKTQVYFEIVPGTTMSPGVVTSMSRGYVELELKPQCVKGNDVYRTEYVRQNDICGTIVRGTKVRICKMTSQMGKLHPSMAYQLSKSANYKPFDIESEGWTNVTNFVLASPSTAEVEEGPVAENGASTTVPNASTVPASTPVPAVVEYKATNSVGVNGHRVRRLPSTDSEQIGSLPPGSTIRLIQVVDGWGKLDISMNDMVKSSKGYKPHDLNTEGWTMLSANGQTYFAPTAAPPVATSTVGSSRDLAPVLLQYKSRTRFGGHGVYQLPTTDSERIGSLLSSQIVSFVQVADGWGKVDISMAPMLQGSNGYKPHDLNIEGWAQISDENETYFDPVPIPAPVVGNIVGSSQSDSTSTGYTTYRTTSDVPSGGVRVRRSATTLSDHIGHIEQGSTVRFTRVENGWAKLHPSMESTLRTGRYYRSHNLENEGWAMFCNNGETYFEVVPNPSVAPSVATPATTVLEYKATSAVGAGGHRIRKLPTTDSEQIGTLRPGCTIRLTQVVDGWGKLDVSMDEMVRGSSTQTSFNLSTDGWTMISGNGQTYFTPTNPIATAAPSAPAVTTPEYVTYKTTDVVKRLGLRIRRQPNLDSEQVGSIEKGATVRISTIQGNWGKVHPSMAPTVNTSYKFIPHDLNTEGWTRISGEEGIFLVPVDTPAVSSSIGAPSTAPPATGWSFPAPATATTTATTGTSSTSSTSNSNVAPIVGAWTFTPPAPAPAPVPAPTPTTTTNSGGSSSESQEYTLYRTTSAVPDGGMMVRRLPTTLSEHCASIAQGATIRVTELFDCSNNLWGKLHPSMSLVGSYNYRTYDVNKEGWTRISGDASSTGQREVFFEVVPGSTISPSVAASMTRGYTEFEPSMQSETLGCRIRRTQSLESNHVGTIPRGSRVRISKIVDGWGKVHPSMAYQLRQSANYQRIDLAIEGWTKMVYGDVINFVLASPSTLPVREDPAAGPSGTTTSVVKQRAPPPVTLEVAVNSLKKALKDYSSLKSLKTIDDKIKKMIEDRKLELESDLETKASIVKTPDADRKVCLVCKQIKTFVVFVPCAHMCICEGCESALPVRRCPHCKQKYNDACKVYM